MQWILCKTSWPKFEHDTLKCDFTSNKLRLNEKYKKNFYGRVRFNSITITITTRSGHGRGQKGVIYLAQSRLFQTP